METETKQHLVFPQNAKEPFLYTIYRFILCQNIPKGGFFLFLFLFLFKVVINATFNAAGESFGQSYRENFIYGEWV